MYFKLFFLVFCITGFAVPKAYSEPIRVVASIFPFADIAKRVGGELVEVDILLRPGKDPHHYEPTPGDARKIANARIVLMAGHGVDDWVLKLVESISTDGQVVVDLSKINRKPETDRGRRAKRYFNPHYWLDPKIMVYVAASIANALMTANPEKSEEIRLRMRLYAKSLKSLDQEIKKTLSAEGVGKNYVSFHNAWVYFARRYRLNQVGVIKKLPGEEPSARHIVRLIEKIKKYKVKAILIDPQSSPGVSQTVATEAGVRLISVDPIGGVPGRESYIKLMRWNTSRFKEALLK